MNPAAAPCQVCMSRHTPDLSLNILSVFVDDLPIDGRIDYKLIYFVLQSPIGSNSSKVWRQNKVNYFVVSVLDGRKIRS